MFTKLYNINLYNIDYNVEKNNNLQLHGNHLNTIIQQQ
jgi:hypothetical protein